MPKLSLLASNVYIFWQVLTFQTITTFSILKLAHIYRPSTLQSMLEIYALQIALSFGSNLNI